MVSNNILKSNKKHSLLEVGKIAERDFTFGAIQLPCVACDISTMFVQEADAGRHQAAASSGGCGVHCRTTEQSGDG